MTQNEPTHAVSNPNRRPLTKLDSIKVTLASTEQHKQLLALLGNEEAVRRFQASAIDYVRRVPKLLETEPQSLMMALVTSAQFNFLPSSAAGEGYIIPYGSEAKFQIGYQGYVTLFYRAGVKDIAAEIVYKNDRFVYEAGLHPKLEHTPAPFGTDRGEPIGVYAVATTPNGGRVFKVMSKEDVMKIKNTSKAKNKSDSPWNSGDPLLAMWKKTCLIQMQKLLPKSAELVRALEVDYEGEGMDKPALDAGGPAVAKVHHAPLPAAADPVDDSIAKCKKHGTALDGDGECGTCIVDAMNKPPLEGTIEA